LTVKEPAGYSLHCISGNDFKETINGVFIPSHEHALTFAINYDNDNQFLVCEGSKMKTLELRINNGKPEVKIVKVMKVAEEIIQLETVHEYQMSILINKSRNLQAIHKNVR